MEQEDEWEEEEADLIQCGLKISGILVTTVETLSRSLRAGSPQSRPDVEHWSSWPQVVTPSGPSVAVTQCIFGKFQSVDVESRAPDDVINKVLKKDPRFTPSFILCF